MEMNTRRDFLKDVLAGITIVGFMPGILTSCGSDDGSGTITVDVSSLDAEGKGLRSTLPDGTPIMVIRRPSNVYVTVQLICTHQGCKGTNLAITGQKIQCGCHGSEYDLNGKVTKGPATADLKSYATSFDAAKNEVTITF